MIRNLRAILVLLLCELLVIIPANPLAAAAPQINPVVLKAFQENLQKSYLELFKISPTLEFSSAQVEQMRKYLDNAEHICQDGFKQRSKNYERQLRSTQAELKRLSAGLSKTRRHDMHCKIQNLRMLNSQTQMLAKHAIPVAYDNRKAKLELIQQWPADLTEIKQEIADGSYLKRRWGDVKDIGFRVIAPGQAKDIPAGEEAIRQMKMMGLMPPKVKDEKIVEYVTHVAMKIARHSDLHVPLHVTVLNVKEINAFALPGGFVFVQRGLLEAVDNESELAGVLGHEISHVIARHSHKLMHKATIASMLYEGAEVAAMILTGGVASIGMYYALQYGFYGLSMAISLKLLGISRKFEMQADQLGIQYAWNAGYDPNGFIRFFDKMATKVGYVNSLSWFYDHPPFYQRMVHAEREIMFLPKKPHPVVNTPGFVAMKKELKKIVAKAKKEEKKEGRPSLLAPEQGCPAPKKIEYKSGEPIEKLCSAIPKTAK